MMKVRKLLGMNQNQSGFTLLEILIGIVIAGIIGSGITTAIVQVFDINARSTARMTAVKEVEATVHWVSRDVQMAQSIEIDEDSGNGFPLNLSWVDWDDNKTHYVEYSIQNSQLQRTYTVDSVGTTKLLITHLDSSLTECDFSDDDNVFTMQVSSTVSGYRTASETRVIEVIPRSAQ